MEEVVESALVRLYLVRLYLKVAQKWLQSMKYDRYKGPSIYYVIPDRGGGVCPIYYNIT